MIFAYLIAGIMIVSIVLSVHHQDSDYIFSGMFYSLIAFLILFIFVLLGSGIVCSMDSIPKDITTSDPMALYAIDDRYYIIESGDYRYYCYENPEDGVVVDKYNKKGCIIHYRDIELPYCTKETREVSDPILRFFFPFSPMYYINFYVPEGTLRVN